MDTNVPGCQTAAFSAASTSENNKNMLVIRGDKGVADNYATELFGLCHHYAFLEWRRRDNQDPSPQFLRPDDSWQNIYFGDTPQFRPRVLFSGTAE